MNERCCWKPVFCDDGEKFPGDPAWKPARRMKEVCAYGYTLGIAFVPGPPHVSDINFIPRVFGKSANGRPILADRAVWVDILCKG